MMFHRTSGKRGFGTHLGKMKVGVFLSNISQKERTYSAGCVVNLESAFATTWLFVPENTGPRASR